MTGNRSVLVLGSTGSIGTQALELIARHPERFTVAGLAAGGGDVALLAEQVRAHRVPRVAVAAEDAARALRELLPGVEVLAGPDAATELTATTSVDTVLNGITGAVGLGPTLAALAAGATLALANKESLVAGGALVTAAAAPGQIVPVDSEHSALAQCLRGGRAEEVDRLVLTASGGPFRGRRRAELADVTVAEALAHPTWDMGPMVTLNSATLINKGLELIEAHLLFGIPYDRIDVVVHPQSIVHSMVTFVGRRHASPRPARRTCGCRSALALAWPQRLPGAAPSCRWDTAQSWTFEPLDDDALPGVRLARAAGHAGRLRARRAQRGQRGGRRGVPRGRLLVHRASPTRSRACSTPPTAWTADPATVADVLAAQDWARARARELARDRPGVAR